MKTRTFKFLLCALLGIVYAAGVNAASSLFSNYGQIQNVQNYSTNPFWTPNSPYNKKMPQPVYVQGADLKTEDWINVVQSLVSVQCMVRDNCKDTSLSDIRPAVMIQLSNLPGANYVSACSGYIDTIYEEYVAYYGNNAPTQRVEFPTATTPNPDLQYYAFPAANNQPELPKWQKEMNQRAEELERLQKQNAMY